MQNRKRKIRVSILIALLLACMVIVGLLARSKPSNNPYFFEEGIKSREKNQEKQDISVSESVIEKVLLEKVPELYAYEEYIQKESNGQAGLCIQIYELTEITDNRFWKEGKYYPIYVGESRETYNVNWDWFYVSQDLETIYWYDIVEGMFYSLDEWRISDKYRKLTGNELRQDIDYELYMEFLEGSRSVNGMMITDITTPTREPDKYYFTEYTFSDSDTDGLDELHIRSERYYYIIDCENDELSVWKDLHPRTELLNNGDYLYTHIGGAPLHHDYKYFRMGPEGEEVWSITYNWYDENSNGEFDEEDLYIMQNTNVLSYEEWKEVQENYLNVGTDKVWWRVLEEETSKTEDSQEVIELLTKEEVLQMVFDYEYASWENLVDVTFYETDGVVGYKWLAENDMRYPMYLTVSEIVTTTQGNTYGIVRLAKDIYGTSGVYYRTETYNEFAVNMNTGEIIEMRVYLEEGGWEYSEEYRKKVLGDM